MARAHVTTTIARLTALALMLLVAPAYAGPTPGDRGRSRQMLKSIVERIDETTAHRYAVTDDRGTPLEGLKVVQAGGRSIGLYHAPGGGRFNVHVATSTDLLSWTRRATLDEDASQPTITVTPGGGAIVAYEKTTLLDRLPRAPLPASALAHPLQVLDGPYNRIRIRFRYYRSIDDLLEGRHAREFTAPRRLSPTAEGTPSITSATLSGGRISRSRIEVGLHYYANAPGGPQVDRRATATLTNFRSWQQRARPDVDDAFLSARTIHDGFTTPPRGSLGDRDQVIVDGVRLELQEAQYQAGDFSSWRLFLVDPRSRAPRPLQIVTEGGSRSFGNPTVTELTSPSGRRAMLVTVYVFSEGAARGESGPLIYYREL